MRLAAIRTPDGTRAVRIDAGGVETGRPDVGSCRNTCVAEKAP
jgi:hypothetical protein